MTKKHTPQVICEDCIKVGGQMLNKRICCQSIRERLAKGTIRV